MATIDAFIISWHGYHSEAAHIAECIHGCVSNSTIVYSDPDDSVFFPGIDAVRRPNDLFFGDKFQVCLDRCKSDILLLIHADCLCESWPALISNCLEAFNNFSNISLWAPNIDNTPFNVKITEVLQIEGSDLSAVAQTDALVLAFDRLARDRLRKSSFEGNIHGWGGDWTMICNAYSSGRIAVIDRGINVHHRPGTGYSPASAKQEMRKFLEQLTINEKVVYEALYAYIALRRKKAARLAKKGRFSLSNILPRQLPWGTR